MHFNECHLVLLSGREYLAIFIGISLVRRARTRRKLKLTDSEEDTGCEAFDFASHFFFAVAVTWIAFSVHTSTMKLTSGVIATLTLTGVMGAEKFNEIKVRDEKSCSVAGGTTCNSRTNV